MNDELVLDAPGYIKPCEQNLLLADITPQMLKDVAFALELEYLKSASFPGSFPVTGKIWSINNRLMINLVCCLRTADSPARNIVFLLCTGSPYTYLSLNAMKSLMGQDCEIPTVLLVRIHCNQVIQTNLSPTDSNFANVNVLGMDFLAGNLLSLCMNFNQKEFSLE